jgi:hypothetical protein
VSLCVSLCVRVCVCLCVFVCVCVCVHLLRLCLYLCLCLTQSTFCVPIRMSAVFVFALSANFHYPPLSPVRARAIQLRAHSCTECFLSFSLSLSFSFSLDSLSLSFSLCLSPSLLVCVWHTRATHRRFKLQMGQILRPALLAHLAQIHRQRRHTGNEDTRPCLEEILKC